MDCIRDSKGDGSTSVMRRFADQYMLTVLNAETRDIIRSHIALICEASSHLHGQVDHLSL